MHKINRIYFYIFRYIRRHLIFLLILLGLLFLRLYRIDELTTFGGDQGQDFLVVRDMVIYQKWTLIGIKTSIGDFFQGPLYLYMLFPMFWLMKLNPLAGPLTAVLVAASTLIALYITAYKFFSKRVAEMSSILYAVSPVFVQYGNTPLYQHFLPLFIVVSIFIYLLLVKKRSVSLALCLGIAIGLGLELHFLNISLAIVYFIDFVLRRFQFRIIVGYVAGIATGLLPTIVFELRHQFLNTTLFMRYLQASGHESATPFLSSPSRWILGTAEFFGGNNYFIGLFLLLFTAISLTVLAHPAARAFADLRRLVIVLFIVLAVITVKMPAFQNHYLLPFWVLLLFAIPVLCERYMKKMQYGMWLFVIIVLINVHSSVIHLGNNHGYNMPNGWTMKKIVQVSDIISNDANKHANYNVASLLDGNTRTYPIRYALAVNNQNPGAVDSYPNNDFLYVVSGSDQRALFKSRTWEVVSVAPFLVGKSWQLGDGIVLYRLDRKKGENMQFKRL